MQLISKFNKGIRFLLCAIEECVHYQRKYVQMSYFDQSPSMTVWTSLQYPVYEQFTSIPANFSSTEYISIFVNVWSLSSTCCILSVILEQDLLKYFSKWDVIHWHLIFDESTIIYFKLVFISPFLKYFCRHVDRVIWNSNMLSKNKSSKTEDRFRPIFLMFF